MLTAKEVREVIFPRSMGNYRKDEVDDFLDRCADTIEELSKQNEENSRKMQVLAQTVMDYRNQEDSIRSALISAQRMSESVISDAHKQADDIIEAARSEAESMRETALAATVAEQNELKRVKQEVADFKAKLMSIYREHLTLIGVLEGEAAEEVAEVEAPVTEPQQPAEPVFTVADHHDMPDFSELELKEE
ncbi:MAG: DivIVA domain-containing protein [Clostridia bacterium]|nr:DivIVA domain-containing protein [Clostridia bacterium]